ncbi:MAG TPA: hypothetical protein ENJ93_10410 [Chloroflexi bacterium]|nr:hypothetical protein [Chloroflexota bacterium]
MAYDPGLDDPETDKTWREMMRTIMSFGLPRSTAARLTGLQHVNKDMVDRWAAYCRLRGPQSRHGSKTFFHIRLARNDVPPPSWGAIRRLEKKLQEKKEAQNERV